MRIFCQVGPQPAEGSIHVTNHISAILAASYAFRQIKTLCCNIPNSHVKQLHNWKTEKYYLLIPTCKDKLIVMLSLNNPNNANIDESNLIQIPCYHRSTEAFAWKRHPDVKGTPIKDEWHRHWILNVVLCVSSSVFKDTFGTFLFTLHKMI